ncbi:DL-endopeptidase inhibitor IseA family protein [Sporosarcina sp. FSL K6-1508]|uniref:DL-endopeptidase inhibitor IseA family protein n=1 Tax=Sporosarcina sp. FSL K6-1508 TaxID=2921553 RepID=UPI0030FBC1D9
MKMKEGSFIELKKIWLVVLSLLLVLCTACQKSDSVVTKKNEVSSEKAVELAANWATTVSLVQAGGVYSEGEYERFNYKGETYRYMASYLDTKKELRAELEKSVTKKVARKFMKEHRFIKHKRRLAQLEADEGSLLQWGVATAKEVKSKKNKSVFELSVPVGYTGTFDKFEVTYEYVKKSGWRISKLPEYKK